ncbi:MAG: type II toxin-antitoxin system Phd/YefM family antitoxin [Verrucomicrobia bacterium]|nr:type II toxin-antitoxin system Phd/YefM family antitoxin [Verrucomicrobiota bacterium]
MGELLDEVRLTSEQIVIERAGKPVAMLCPIERAETTQARRLGAVREASGMYTSSPRSSDPDHWQDEERSQWDS